MIFLLIYDASTSTLAGIKEYPESGRAQAMNDLRAAQEEHLDDLERIEIALFEAPSRATLERTHSRYFKSFGELRHNLAAETPKSA